MRACNQTRTSAYIKLKLGESVLEISIGVSGISSNALTSPVLSLCPTLSLSLLNYSYIVSYSFVLGLHTSTCTVYILVLVCFQLL